MTLLTDKAKKNDDDLIEKEQMLDVYVIFVIFIETFWFGKTFKKRR